MQSKHNQPCGLGDIAVSELVLQLDAAAAEERYSVFGATSAMRASMRGELYGRCVPDGQGRRAHAACRQPRLSDGQAACRRRP